MVTSNRDHDLPEEIVCIDVELLRPGLAACYLLLSGGRAAFVDTGPAPALAKLLDALSARGLDAAAVDFVLPTHVHLDHAGATGALLAHLPNAKVIVHPRGAKHLIEPEALVAGSKAVYGERAFARYFGEVVAVSAERVVEAHDGMTVDLDGRVLRLVDTPGHASHHYCVWDERSQGLFTGDTFGLIYPELACGERPFVFPPTTPVQFKPDVWQQSLDRLEELQPKRVYVTHFGMVTEPLRVLPDLRRRIDAMAGIAYDCEGAVDRHAAIREQLWAYLDAELEGHGVTFGAAEVRRLLAPDMELNAQGLAVWLERRAAGNG